MRRIDPGCALACLVPSNEAHSIFAAEEKIVGDQEVSRVRTLGPDSNADIFKTAVAHREGNRAHYFFFAREQRNLSVTKSQAFKDVVLGRHHIEQLVIACAVKDRLAVACTFD